MVLAIFIASLYALTDEVHQYFVPGREMDAKDWTIDLLGSSIGIVVYRIFKVAAKSFARPAS